MTLTDDEKYNISKRAAENVWAVLAVELEELGIEGIMGYEVVQVLGAIIVLIGDSMQIKQEEPDAKPDDPD